MNPERLLRADGSPAPVWRCSTCGVYLGSEDVAKKCCSPCACGAAVVRGTTMCHACQEAKWQADIERRQDQIEAQWLAQETKPDGFEAELWVECDGDEFRTLEAHQEALEEKLVDSHDTEVCQYYHPTEPIDSSVVGRQMYRAHRVIEALYEYSYEGWESAHTEAEYEEALKSLHDLIGTEDLGCAIDASRVLLVIARMGADGEPISEIITDEAELDG